jgi:hypothetical protein
MHSKLDLLEATGFVVLRDYRGPFIHREEWEALEYVPWKCAGAELFAPIASATGKVEFWEHGKPDKDAVWTRNAHRCPTIIHWLLDVGARFGRVRVVKLEPQGYEQAIELLHRDHNNRLNPDREGRIVRVWVELTDNPGSYMILRDDMDDPSTEHRIELRKGAQYVVDSERLYHAVAHAGSHARYALIASFESGPELLRWIEARLPVQAAESAHREAWPETPVRERVAR